MSELGPFTFNYPQKNVFINYILSAPGSFFTPDEFGFYKSFSLDFCRYIKSLVQYKPL